jgi:hypothetical protein
MAPVAAIRWIQQLEGGVQKAANRRTKSALKSDRFSAPEKDDFTRARRGCGTL